MNHQTEKAKSGLNKFQSRLYKTSQFLFQVLFANNDDICLESILRYSILIQTTNTASKLTTDRELKLQCSQYPECHKTHPCRFK